MNIREFKCDVCLSQWLISRWDITSFFVCWLTINIYDIDVRKSFRAVILSSRHSDVFVQRRTTNIRNVTGRMKINLRRSRSCLKTYLESSQEIRKYELCKEKRVITIFFDSKSRHTLKRTTKLAIYQFVFLLFSTDVYIFHFSSQFRDFSLICDNSVLALHQFCVVFKRELFIECFFLFHRIATQSSSFIKAHYSKSVENKRRRSSSVESRELFEIQIFACAYSRCHLGLVYF